MCHDPPASNKTRHRAGVLARSGTPNLKPAIRSSTADHRVTNPSVPGRTLSTNLGSAAVPKRRPKAFIRHYRKIGGLRQDLTLGVHRHAFTRMFMSTRRG